MELYGFLALIVAISGTLLAAFLAVYVIRLRAALRTYTSALTELQNQLMERNKELQTQQKDLVYYASQERALVLRIREVEKNYSSISGRVDKAVKLVSNTGMSEKKRKQILSTLDPSTRQTSVKSGEQKNKTAYDRRKTEQNTHEANTSIFLAGSVVSQPATDQSKSSSEVCSSSSSSSCD